MIKKRANVLLVVYSIVISLLVNMDTAKQIPLDIEQQVLGADYSNHFLLILSKLLYPITQINAIPFIIIACLTAYLIRYIHRLASVNYWTKGLNILVAVVLAIYLVYGKLVKNNVYDEILSGGKTAILLLIFNICGIAFFMSLCFVALEKYVKRYLSLSSSEKKPQEEYVFNWKKEFLTILLCWIPYMIILFPATWSWDTINQLSEFFGHGHSIFDVYPIGHYLLTQDTFTITNQHNFFVTLFYGFNFKIGDVLFHNANIGLFISAFIQSVIYISVLVYSLLVFKRLGMRSRLIHAFKWGYALFPVFPILSLYLVKNIPYSMFLLWFILLLTGALNDKEIVSSRLWQIGLWLSVLLQLITEKYAIYIIILLIIIFAFSINGRLRKTILLGMIVPTCLFVIGEGVLFSALNVSSGDPIEGKAVMIQQTALYVKKYPNDLTPYQNKVINKVFVKKNLGKLYNPELADPIKSSGAVKPLIGYRYKTVTRSDMKQYNKVWLQMFKQHPLVYFEAFLNGSYGYLDANYIVANSSAENQSDLLPLSHTEFKIEVGKHKAAVGLSNYFLGLREILSSFINVLHHVLPFSLVLNGNILVIATLLIFLLLTSLESYRTLLIIMPLFLQIPVILLSPVNGSQRYMYPFIMIFMVVLGIVLTIIRRKKAS